jgi:hypothetical protein
MSSIQKSVISGFNEYINGLKNQGGSVKFSLTMFDTVSIDKPYVNADIKSVEPLNDNTYRPNAGTPLYDAAVDTIETVYEEVEHKEDYAVVTVIMTDGEENSSQRHTEKCLKELIEKLEDKGNWTFVFMGANMDSYATAEKFGIARGNTVNWQSSNLGSQNAFRGLACSTVDYANSVVAMGAMGDAGPMGTKAFYSESVKDLIEKGDDKNVTRP